MHEKAISPAANLKTLHFQWKERPIRRPGRAHLHRLEHRGIINPFIYNLSDEQLNLPTLLANNTQTSFLFVYTEDHQIILGIENPFCSPFFDHCNPHLQQYLMQALDHLIHELIEEELTSMLEASPTKGHVWKILREYANTEQNKIEIISLIRQVVQLKPELSATNPELAKVFSDKACRVAILKALTLGHPSIISSNNPCEKPARLGGEFYYNATSKEWVLENRSGRYSRELEGDFVVDHYANTLYLLAVAKQLKMLGVESIRCNLFIKEKIRSHQGKISNPDKDKLAFLNRCIQSYLDADFQFMCLLAQIVPNDRRERGRELSLQELKFHFSDMECEVLEALFDIHRCLCAKPDVQNKYTRLS